MFDSYGIRILFDHEKALIMVSGESAEENDSFIDEFGSKANHTKLFELSILSEIAYLLFQQEVKLRLGFEASTNC
ncbi:MAG: hypothetical protein PF488_01510 [Patescibacteria group bacterium]|jgi:hypothetical protein|nr:hypothetical protein [Patescibacteria group bacterium]